MDEDVCTVLNDRDGEGEEEPELIIVDEAFGERVLDTELVAEFEVAPLAVIVFDCTIVIDMRCGVDDCNDVNDGDNEDEDVFTVLNDRDGEGDEETDLIIVNEAFGERVLETELVAELDVAPLVVIVFDCIIVRVIRCGVDD